MFVTFEGIDGAGKSTALHQVDAALRLCGVPTLRTREPGGCRLGERLRAILLEPHTGRLAERAELHLFLADRAQHVAEVITPALNAGKIVLCDRFTDSTLAYQGFARGLDVPNLRRLNDMATGGLAPDVTLLFNLPVSEGLSRIAGRRALHEEALSEGRFDAESLAFHDRVRQGYLTLAAEEPERFMIVDAALPREEVATRCLQAVANALRRLGRAAPKLGAYLEGRGC